VAAPQVGQGDRAEARRLDRGRDLADFRTFPEQLRPLRQHADRAEAHAAQVAVDVPAVAGHDDRFLPEVATFRERDGALLAVEFDDEAFILDLLPVDRRPRFDAQHVVGVQAGQLRAPVEKALPHLVGPRRGAEDVVARQAQQVRVQCAEEETFRAFFRLREFAQCFLQHVRGERAGQVELRRFGAAVEDPRGRRAHARGSSL